MDLIVIEPFTSASLTVPSRENAVINLPKAEAEELIKLGWAKPKQHKQEDK